MTECQSCYTEKEETEFTGRYRVCKDCRAIDARLTRKLERLVATREGRQTLIEKTAEGLAARLIERNQ